MAKGKSKGQFIVDISAMDLNEKELLRIEEGINKVVLSTLSRHKSKWNSGFRVFDISKIRPGTLGIWIGDRDWDGIPDNIDFDVNF